MFSSMMEYTKRMNFVVGFSGYEKMVQQSPYILEMQHLNFINSREPLIDVYVGSGSYRELVTRVPAAVLEYFAPKYCASLSENNKTAPLELPNCCKHAVKWIMNWMGLGVMDEKGYEDTSLFTMSPTDRLLNRLQAVTELEMGGQIYKTFFLEFTELVITGVIPANQLDPILNEDAPLHIKGMCKDLALSIVENVLNRKITAPVLGITQNPLLAADVKYFLSTKTHRLHDLQRIYKIPISTFQLNFLYTFTDTHSPLRRKVAVDLLDLVDTGNVPNEAEYKQFSAENAEFDGDLTAAIAEKAARKRPNKKEKAAIVMARRKKLVREIVQWQEIMDEAQSGINDAQPQSLIFSTFSVDSQATAPYEHVRRQTRAPAPSQTHQIHASTRAEPSIPPTRQHWRVFRVQNRSETDHREAENHSVAQSTPEPEREAEADGMNSSQTSEVAAATPAEAAPTSGRRVLSTTILSIGADRSMER